MAEMYEGRMDWVSGSEGTIPMDKRGFIFDKGLRAFAEEVTGTALCSAYRFDSFSEFTANEKRWFNIPDDWSFEEFMAACRDIAEELFWEQKRKEAVREAERKAAEKDDEKKAKKAKKEAEDAE